jgi:hypothetical protein
MSAFIDDTKNVDAGKKKNKKKKKAKKDQFNGVGE